MWLDLVATGVTILSHFGASSTKGYLVLPTGDRSNTPPGARMIGRLRDASCSNIKQHMVVWVGG
jgi:hypothetical protein